MHACGEIYGRRASNCRESFYKWYKKGARFFEIDVATSIDGEFVCVAHGLTPKFLNKYQITNCEENASSEWFLKQKLFPVTIRGGVTPMSLKDVLNLIKDHPDIVVMLDSCLMNLPDFEAMLTKIQNMCTSLGIKAKEKILVETYTPDMQKTLLKSDLQCEGIYCVHDSRYDFDTNKIIELLRDMDVHFVSYPWSFAVKEQDLLKRVVAKGINVLSVSRDNLDAAKMKALGIKINLVSFFYRSLLETIVKLPINCALRKFGYMYYKFKTGKESY